MATVNTALSPYYDDYSPTKNYNRILFRGGRAVQARELTQLQTALQQQIRYHGDHVFKDGSTVLDGQTNLNVDAEYARLYDNQGIGDTGTVANVSLAFDTTTYDGLVVVSDLPAGHANTADGRTVQAKVLQASDRTASDPKTLILQYQSGDRFAANDAIRSVDSVFKARVEEYDGTTQPTGEASVFSLGSGVFYAKGFFIYTPKQSIILNKYNNTPTYKIGVTYTESIAESATDSTLLDNAQGTYNVNAPGADRLKVDLVLSVPSDADGISISDTADVDFFEIARVVDGVYQSSTDRPIYSEFSRELARRTFDESGDYVVKPFVADIEENNIDSPNSRVNIGISPGKAYVKGYEIEKISRTTLVGDKPRTFEGDTHSSVLDLGNYIKIQNPSNGIFQTSTYPVIDFHVANTEIIDATALSDAPGILASTIIANARVKAIKPVTVAQPERNSESLSYNLYLFDIRANTIANTISSATTSAITTNLKGNYLYDGIFVGGKMRITQAGHSTYNETRNIIAYNKTSGLFTVSPAFSNAPPNSGTFEISMPLTFAESVRVGSKATHELSADVANVGKVGGVSTGDTIVFEPENKLMVFPLGRPATKTLSGLSYRGIASGTKTSTSATVTYSLSDVGNYLSAYNSASSLEAAFANTTHGILTATVTDPGASSSTLQAVFSEGAPGAHSFTLTGTVGTANEEKRKTLVEGNIQSVSSIGSSVAMSSKRTSNGWVVFDNPNKVAGRKDVLGMGDVVRIRKVVDSKDSSIAPNTWTLGSSSHDITSNYTLDTGQREAFYDYGALILKPGSPSPVGQIAAVVDYYTHGGGSTNSYFTVDSYAWSDNQYELIPTYTTSTGDEIQLRDSIDFRPRKTDAADDAAAPTDNYFTDFDSQNSPIDNTTLTIDSHSYYLPRTDVLALGTDSTLSVISGVPSLGANPPVVGDSAIALYEVNYPAYTFGADKINLNARSYRRYTMSQIDGINKRLTDIQYYISLNMLQRSALDQTFTDSTGTIERLKNGILVDNFSGFDVADVLSGDYKAGINTTTGILSPVRLRKAFKMSPGSTNLSIREIFRRGGMISPSYTQTPLITQPLASSWINVNDLGIAFRRGALELSPPSDTWMDQDRLGYVRTQSPDLYDRLQQYVDQTVASQDDDDAVTMADLMSDRVTQIGVAGPNFGGPGAGTNRNSWRNPGSINIQIPEGEDVVPSFIVGMPGWSTMNNRGGFSDNQRARDGVQLHIGLDKLFTAMGNQIDYSVSPYIEAQGIAVLSSGMASNTNIYAFFDDVDVSRYVARANIIHFDEAVPFNSQEDEFEFLEDATTTGTTARLLAVRDKVAYVTAANGDFKVGDEVQYRAGAGDPPNTEGSIPPEKTITVTKYEHYSGQCHSAGATTIRLDDSAGNATSPSPEGEQIHIISGTGVGQVRTISSFDATLRMATVSTPWTTTPDSTSSYSIGDMQTNEFGDFLGVFMLPNENGLRFTSGEKPFVLIDRSDGNKSLAKSISENIFYASGVKVGYGNYTDITGTRLPIQTSENLNTDGIGSVSNQPQENREIDPIATNANGPTDNRRTVAVFDGTATDTGVGRGSGYYAAGVGGSPVAETFFIPSEIHPYGCYLTSVDLFFRQKDTNNIPIRLEIRTTLNGQPTTTVLPGSQLTHYGTWNGEVVNDRTADGESVFPDVNSLSTTTRFTFKNPIYVAPGQYAIVLQTNSSEYEVYMAEMGGVQLAAAGTTQNQITEQPYMGSFFKSQNGSTWTERQDQDLMFRINRASFDTGEVTAEFYDSLAGENFVAGEERNRTKLQKTFNYDYLYIKSDTIEYPPQSSMDYSVATTISDSVLASSYIPVDSEKSIKMSSRMEINPGVSRNYVDPRSGSLRIRANMKTSRDDIAPSLDLYRMRAIVSRNIINNGEISNANFFIANTGGGYTEGDTIELTSQRTGTSDSITFSVNVNSTGGISGIWQKPGSADLTGFLDSPLANVVSTTGNFDSDIVVLGETEPLGGNALVRYVTKDVQLEEDFDSKDISVLLTAYNPPAGTIGVYYKVKSKSDPLKFSDHNWTLMKQDTSNARATSLNGGDFREIKYVPYGVDEDLDNPIRYSYTDDADNEYVYSDFNEFAIKIVLISSDTTDVPVVKDIRAIALE